MYEKHEPKLNEIMSRLDAPFFFYDLDILKDHLKNIKKVLHKDIYLFYACKANPMSAILKVLRNLNVGIDVASSGELLQVLNTGISGKNIIATGPGKSKEYLKHLVKSDVKYIVLESINQVKWLNEICKSLKEKKQGILRMQLDWDFGKSVLGGTDITPFGISPMDWAYLNKKDHEHLDLVGVHVFQWGNILDLNRLHKIWEKSIIEAKSLAKHLGFHLRIMDVGGGLGIPYKDNQKEISFNNAHEILLSLKEKHSLDKIFLEFGRYLIGSSGLYFTKVVDKKTVRNKTILVTEGGINHLARVALTKEPFPCEAYNKKSNNYVETIVCGPLCTALDNLGTFYLPDTIGVSDWLVFKNTGAYGFTESMPYFLCHGLSGEVTHYNGDMMIPRHPKNSFEWLI